MKLFYGIMIVDLKKIKEFIKTLPAASSNAIHR